MHVLLLAPLPWPSTQGSQAYVAGQARALTKVGVRVTLAVYGGATGGQIAEVRLLRGRPGVRFDTGGLHWSRTLGDLGLLRTIRAAHRRDPFDLVHAHHVEGAALARTARLGIPIVYDLHTLLAEELPHHLPLPGMHRVGRILDRFALRCADAGCAISARAAEVFTDAGLPHTLVGPQVDLEELQVPQDPTPRVVYTGNLDGYQDLDLLWNLDLSLPLWIATSGTRPLPPQVHAVRTASFRGILRALAGATVGVIPRRQVAGFPIKLLNHLGLGIPTVVMRSAGIHLPGTVASSPTRLQHDIEALIADPDRRASLAEAGRRWVRENATAEVRGAQLRRLYRGVMSRTPASTP